MWFLSRYHASSNCGSYCALHSQSFKCSTYYMCAAVCMCHLIWHDNFTAFMLYRYITVCFACVRFNQICQTNKLVCTTLFSQPKRWKQHKYENITLAATYNYHTTLNHWIYIYIAHINDFCFSNYARMYWKLTSIITKFPCSIGNNISWTIGNVTAAATLK